MKGKGFLKVCGILMIIGGAISVILSIVAVIGASAVAAAAAYLGLDVGTIVFASILALVGAGLELATGIVGVKNAAHPEKANSCLVLGIIVAALSLISNIIYFSGVFSLLLGLVLPVLFVIGAVLNKQSK